MAKQPRPKLLDLFCGAGGAAVGYHQAGFEVIGVDLNPQPRYPFQFIQADAMTFDLSGFHAIHASPPCQAYSRAGWQVRHLHEALIEPVRQLLQANTAPWVIEGTTRATFPPDTVYLCGEMFRLGVIRHRRFQTSFYLPQPEHKPHRGYASHKGASPQPQFGETYHTVAGHYGDWPNACKAMGITWMERNELAQAIPPAYTSWVGQWLRAAL